MATERHKECQHWLLRRVWHDQSSNKSSSPMDLCTAALSSLESKENITGEVKITSTMEDDW